MATGTMASTPSSGPPSEVPLLQNGDHLSREEFERRYHAMPKLKKAELIEGVVYVPSPIRYGRNSSPQFNLIGWLGRYVTATPGISGGINGTVRLDHDNEAQPEAVLIVSPECGGRVAIDEDDYIVGGPEWIGEITASSASYDLHPKLNAYRRNGVQEYLVWRLEDRAIDWFALRAGRYEPLPCTDGIYRSAILPGLWLAQQALIHGNLQEVVRVLERGLQDDAHRSFVDKLTQAKAAR